MQLNFHTWWIFYFDCFWYEYIYLRFWYFLEILQFVCCILLMSCFIHFQFVKEFVLCKHAPSEPDINIKLIEYLKHFCCNPWLDIAAIIWISELLTGTEKSMAGSPTMSLVPTFVSLFTFQCGQKIFLICSLNFLIPEHFIQTF